MFSPRLSASLPQQEQSGISGTIRNSAGQPVGDARVTLMGAGSSAVVEVKSGMDGSFAIEGISPGVYRVSARKAEWGEATAEGVSIARGEKKRIELILGTKKPVDGKPAGGDSGKSPSFGAVEFEDKPSFTVAGVTDWSNVGLHGSGMDVRTSETLAKETARLKPGEPGEIATDRDAEELEGKLKAAMAKAPESFEANHQLGEFYCQRKKYGEAIPLLLAAAEIQPANVKNSYELALSYAATGKLREARMRTAEMISATNTAESHRLAGSVYERLGDPLEAVREFEKATRMDGSEENYFEWGSELLVHRAAKPAAEVFEKGFEAHPDSARMLTGLGAAFFADGAFDEATKQLCRAADLAPRDPAPYVFLGKIEEATVETFACSEEKLAKFAREQPENALANYYCGIAVGKRAKSSEDQAGGKRAEDLFEKSVRLEPKLDAGYLRLGIVHGEQGRFERAAADYEKAIEINPRSGQAHFRLAAVYRRLGKTEQAQAELRKYHEIEKAEEEERERERRELGQFRVIQN